MPPMRLNLGFLTTTKSTPTHSSRTTSVDRKRVRFPSLGLSPSSDDEQLVYNTLFLVSSQYQTPLCSARDYSFYSSIRQARWLSYYRSSWPLYLTPVFTSVTALGIHVLKSLSLFGISDGLMKCHKRQLDRRHDENTSNKNETDIINHKLYTQQQVEIANPIQPSPSYPNRYERRHLAAVAKQGTLNMRQEVIHHAPFEYSRSSRSFFFWLAPLTIVDRSPTVENNISKHSNAIPRQERELTGKLEGEVQRSEQDSKEDPPSQHACDESASASGDEQSASLGDAALSEVPVSAGEAAESSDEGSEDADEDHVGAERADHVDEAEETHPELEETWREEQSQHRVLSIGAWRRQ
jgi:hypothetical protein